MHSRRQPKALDRLKGIEVSSGGFHPKKARVGFQPSADCSFPSLKCQSLQATQANSVSTPALHFHCTFADVFAECAGAGFEREQRAKGIEPSSRIHGMETFPRLRNFRGANARSGSHTD